MSWRRAVVWFAAVAACGGDDGGGAMPDAPTDQPDAPLPLACREMEVEPVAVPAQVDGDVLGGGADLTSPTACATIDAPYGVESAGADRVVRLGGLTPGTTYGVRLASNEDLAFYVITGCSTDSGPADGDCALFVDAMTVGYEFGAFTAAGADAWVVVDRYTDTDPLDGSFMLEVYPVECVDNDGCSGQTPACLAGRCVGCVTSFDCTSPFAPACDELIHTCVQGSAGCAGDDAAEPADDGPAGAPTLTPNGAGVATRSGAICAQPDAERDYARFVVGSPAERWTIDLAWATGDDLDVVVYDAAGVPLGISFYEQPERIALRHLAPGDYFVEIDDFTTTGPAVPYTLTATRTAGAACYDASDCAVEYRNQIHRGACVGGACVSIDGGGGVPEGGACDSHSDCVAGTDCPSFFFVSDADTRSTCGRECAGDADCAPLGADYVCTTYLPNDFCVQKCTEDDHCPTLIGVVPSVPPWERMTCQVSTGRCLP
jgi:hypothetical protein